MIQNPEFQVHLLSPEGITRAQEISRIFDEALLSLIGIIPPGRELSIVKTKLEEACFFAKKAMSKADTNQLPPQA